MHLHCCQWDVPSLGRAEAQSCNTWLIVTLNAVLWVQELLWGRGVGTAQAGAWGRASTTGRRMLIGEAEPHSGKIGSGSERVKQALRISVGQ